MGSLDGLFGRNVAPTASREETPTDPTDPAHPQAITHTLEILVDSKLTPLSMARQLLLQSHSHILDVEDLGERSVLEGKYDAAALKVWMDILNSGKDSRPLAATLEDDGLTLDQRNLADVQEFQFFNVETAQEAVELAKLKEEGRMYTRSGEIRNREGM